MNQTLKEKIIQSVIDNRNEFQLYNYITNEYKAYIFDTQGEYLIGGEEIANFIREFTNLYTK